jgi:hypothetical protein
MSHRQSFIGTGGIFTQVKLSCQYHPGKLCAKADKDGELLSWLCGTRMREFSKEM